MLRRKGVPIDVSVLVIVAACALALEAAAAPVATDPATTPGNQSQGVSREVRILTLYMQLIEKNVQSGPDFARLSVEQKWGKVFRELERTLGTKVPPGVRSIQSTRGQIAKGILGTLTEERQAAVVAAAVAGLKAGGVEVPGEAPPQAVPPAGGTGAEEGGTGGVGGTERTGGKVLRKVYYCDRCKITRERSGRCPKCNQELKERTLGVPEGETGAKEDELTLEEAGFKAQWIEPNIPPVDTFRGGH